MSENSSKMSLWKRGVVLVFQFEFFCILLVFSFFIFIIADLSTDPLFRLVGNEPVIEKGVDDGEQKSD